METRKFLNYEVQWRMAQSSTLSEALLSELFEEVQKLVDKVGFEKGHIVYIWEDQGENALIVPYITPEPGSQLGSKRGHIDQSARLFTKFGLEGLAILIF